MNWDISFSQSVLEEAVNGRIDDHDMNSKIIKWSRTAFGLKDMFCCHQQKDERQDIYCKEQKLGWRDADSSTTKISRNKTHTLSKNGNTLKKFQSDFFSEKIKIETHAYSILNRCTAKSKNLEIVLKHPYCTEF